MVFAYLTSAHVSLYKSNKAPDVNIPYFNKALLVDIQQYKNLPKAVFMAHSVKEQT